MRKVILLLILLMPLSVKASCSSSSLSRYKDLASNISYYYNHNGSSFDLVFYNVSSEFRIVSKSDDKEYFPSSNLGNVVVNGLPSGNINFGVYPINGECKEYRVFTFSVVLPYLNKYFNDPVCLNNDNALCSKWVNTSMYSREQFVEAVEGSNNNGEEIAPEKEVHKYGFFDFLTDYYIYILLFIIIGGSVGIYFLDKKSKFDFSVS